MESKFFGSVVLWILVGGTGCTSVQAAGPYVRNINLDSDGRVSSFERCTLVMHYTGDVLQIQGEDCEDVHPGKAPPVPSAPVPVSKPPVTPSG